MNTKKKIERKYTGWEEELGNLLTKMSEYYLIDDEFESELKWFISTLLQAQQERIVEEIKKKLPKLRGFEDYSKHVHTYATENRGNCGICGLSWKITTGTGYYNQAIFDVKKILKNYLSTIKRKRGEK